MIELGGVLLAVVLLWVFIQRRKEMARNDEIRRLNRMEWERVHAPGYKEDVL